MLRKLYYKKIMTTSNMIQNSNNYYNLNENIYFPEIKNKILNNDFKSDDSCHFKIKKIVLDDTNYYMVNYKKQFINKENNYELGLLRSLILDDNCNILCFSPMKSDNKTHFFEFNTNKEDIIIEPLFEGTMINLFYDNRVNNWLISTKSTIGANVSYFKNSIDKSKTFKEMVDDAMITDNIKFELLEKTHVFSFVLQHPENRIVSCFNFPKLIFIEKYSIKDNIVLCEITPIQSQMKFNFDFNIQTGPYENIQVPPTIMGCVIKNRINNQRVKYRNPTFEYVKQLRGNQPKLEYTYLQLRKHNKKLEEFLQWYPEHSSEMFKYKKKVHAFTTNLYNNYISCYMKKVKPLKEYPYEFKNHMFTLHEIYKEEMKFQGKSMQYNDVINYVNGLHESKLMFALNYNFRENNKKK